MSDSGGRWQPGSPRGAAVSPTTTTHPPPPRSTGGIEGIEGGQNSWKKAMFTKKGKKRGFHRGRNRTLDHGSVVPKTCGHAPVGPRQSHSRKRRKGFRRKAPKTPSLTKVPTWCSSSPPGTRAANGVTCGAGESPPPRKGGHGRGQDDGVDAGEPATAQRAGRARGRGVPWYAAGLPPSVASVTRRPPTMTRRHANAAVPTATRPA